MQTNKRKLSFLFFIAACVVISVAATKPSPTSNIAVATADTGIFKNLKVLPKDISKEKLDTIMHQFTAALGVKCNFCHAMGSNGHPDFPSDDKQEKDIARYMMHMTGEINAKYFNSENSTMPDTISVVKCVTCHHGNPHPNEASMMMGNNNHGNMPPPPPPPGDTSHKMQPPPNQ